MDLSLQIIINEQGDTHELALGENTSIGRTHSNRIQIKENYISSKHAVIHRNEDGGYVIEDRSSKNGTFLNETSVKGPTEIAAGDVVRFGKAACRVVETQKADSASGAVSTGVDVIPGAAIAGGLAAAGAVGVAAGAALGSTKPAATLPTGDLTLSASSPPVANSVGASTSEPVAWVWEAEDKAGFLTNFSFTAKYREDLEKQRKEKGKSKKRPYLALEKEKKGYDPFSTTA